MSKHKSPKNNVDAGAFSAFLDAHKHRDLDLDDIERVYINNVWIDPTLKRILRRYRNGHIRTLRPAVATRILTQLNFTLEDFNGRS